MIHLLGEFNCNGSLLAIDPCYEDDNDGVLIEEVKTPAGKAELERRLKGE